MRRGRDLVRRASEFVRLGVDSGAAGFAPKQFRVHDVSSHGDYITAFAWNGSVVSGSELAIAKPWDCRRSPFDGRTIDGIAYAYSTHIRRTATVGAVVETQTITPSYVADVTIIYAVIPSNGTGAWNVVTERRIRWVELPGRMFAAESSV